MYVYTNKVIALHTHYATVTMQYAQIQNNSYISR